MAAVSSAACREPTQGHARFGLSLHFPPRWRCTRGRLAKPGRSNAGRLLRDRAIAWRMNDWVSQVRDAAAACAARSFAITRPELLLETAWALFDRQNSWSRWGTDRDIVQEMISRPDVVRLLLEQIIG